LTHLLITLRLDRIQNDLQLGVDRATQDCLHRLQAFESLLSRRVVLDIVKFRGDLLEVSPKDDVEVLFECE
jgi:hypothetical protein